MSSFVNINLEVLKGCPFSCSGCYVNKEGENEESQVDLERLKGLLGDMTEKGEIPHIVFLGPTDFLASENTEDILRDNTFKVILKKFKKISLQTTFGDFRNAEAIAHALKEYENQEIEVNFVIEPEKLKKQNYISKVRERKTLFETFLKRFDVETYGILNAYSYKEFEESLNYLELHEKLRGVIQTGIDFNFSVGRSPEMKVSEFQSFASAIQSLHNRVQFSKKKISSKTELSEKQFNYIGGKLYYSPLFYERMAILSEEFKIPLSSYSYDEVLDFEEKLLQSQKSLLENQEDCFKCLHNELCMSRGVVYLMDQFDTPKCYMPRENPKFIHDMGTLPLK